MSDRVHSLKGYVLYSLGSVPSAFPYNMIGSYFVVYYLTLGISMENLGVILMIYGIWNDINDPIMGYFMDRPYKFTRTKGRRIPYVIVGSFLLSIGFSLLWWIPWTKPWMVFLHALFSLLIFDLGFSLAMTAWSALYTEMYEDNTERAKVVAIKDTFAFLSSMMGTVLPPLLASFLGYPIVGIIIGGISLITGILSVFGSREKKEYQIDPPLPILQALKETLKNKAFIITALTYMLIDFAFGFSMLVLPLWAKFILLIPEGLVGFSAGGVAVGILLSIPFWRWAYALKGPKWSLLLALTIFTIGFFPLLFMPNFTLFICYSFIPGLGIAGLLMTEPVISATIDIDEIATKTRREATYTGILTMIARLSIVLSGLSLIILKFWTKFDPDADILTGSALIGLKIAFAVIPSCGGIIAILVFSFYPLNYSNMQVLQHQMIELHAARKKRLLTEMDAKHEK